MKLVVAGDGKWGCVWWCCLLGFFFVRTSRDRIPSRRLFDYNCPLNTQTCPQVDAAAQAYLMATAGMLAAASTPTLAQQPSADVCASAAPPMDEQGAYRMQLDGSSVLAFVYGDGAVWAEGEVAHQVVEAFGRVAGDTFAWMTCTPATLAIKERAVRLLSTKWWTEPPAVGVAGDGGDHPAPVVLVVCQAAGEAGTCKTVF
jgi:hypothetical protein